jgi:hypothetical protein
MRRTALFLALMAGFAFAAPPAGTFPAKVKVGSKSLEKNGKGLCEWGFFQIDLYHAALYLEKRSKDAREILKSDQAKRIHLYFVRDLSTKQLKKAWNAAFEVNAGKELKRYAKRVEQLNGMMSDIKDGQSMVFTHKPGAGIHVVINGKDKGTIKGDDFARMFFTLYLGDNPPDEDLKKGLLSIR